MRGWVRAQIEGSYAGNRIYSGFPGTLLPAYNITDGLENPDSRWGIYAIISGTQHSTRFRFVSGGDIVGHWAQHVGPLSLWDGTSVQPQSKLPIIVGLPGQSILAQAFDDRGLGNQAVPPLVNLFVIAREISDHDWQRSGGSTGT